jgi:nucleoside-diphosphate-sugar epimerase
LGDQRGGARKKVALVTGAAGFIGCHLTERLVADGWTVRGVDDERSGDWSRLRAEIDRYDRDLVTLSPPELEELCRGADVVLHLAAE